MDVQKKQGRQQVNLKHFTLNATVAALLTLQAKAGRADEICPLDITGTILTPCYFNTNSSVTVKNGGTVGGIIMDSYHPSASTIVIDAGGSVSNSTATGIKISNSSLTNGLINNGTIQSQGIGIFVDDTGGRSRIDGGIANNGTIATTHGTGIKINNSTVTGGISNSGTITAVHEFDGIAVVDGSTLTGDITNTKAGEITADNAIFLRQATMTGNIINNGTIHANHPTDIDQSAAGIVLANTAYLDGDISNNGSIITVGAASTGIVVRSSSEVTGTISNSGLISSDHIGLTISTGIIDKGISNSGTISGGDTGIRGQAL